MVQAPEPMLPYRDETGRVTLCLVQESLDAINSASIDAPDKEKHHERLSKWLKHAQRHFNATPVSWEKRDDGQWHSSAGEVRKEVSSAAASNPAPAEPKAVAAQPPGAADTAKWTEAQLRKEKLLALARSVRQQAESTQEKKQAAATALFGNNHSTPRDVTRQDSNVSG